MRIALRLANLYDNNAIPLLNFHSSYSRLIQRRIYDGTTISRFQKNFFFYVRPTLIVGCNISVAEINLQRFFVVFSRDVSEMCTINSYEIFVFDRREQNSVFFFPLIFQSAVSY